MVVEPLRNTQRPRYVFTLAEPPGQLEQALHQVRQAAAVQGLHWEVVKTAGHHMIQYPRPQRRLGTPHLDIALEATAAGPTEVRLLVAPAPGIWTLFMFGYAVAALLVIGGLILGYSQYLLDQAAAWFYLAPLGLLLAALVYGLARYGRWRNRDQTQALLQLAEKAFHVKLQSPGA